MVIGFSKDIQWPESWSSKRQLAERLISLKLKSCANSDESGNELPFKLKNFKASEVTYKMEFENPGGISLGCQTNLDGVVILFPEDLILLDKDGNSLIIDPRDFKKGNGTLDIEINI